MSIFVFGSNRKGIHGAGSAKAAVESHGAQFGVGEGRTGDAYAIPTKETPYRLRSLRDIQVSVDAFLQYAREHQELKFQVVRIGCGLAGYRDEQMAPLFSGAPGNCGFDFCWQKYGLKPWSDLSEDEA